MYDVEALSGSTRHLEWRRAAILRAQGRHGPVKGIELMSNFEVAVLAGDLGAARIFHPDLVSTPAETPQPND